MSKYLNFFKSTKSVFLSTSAIGALMLAGCGGGNGNGTNSVSVVTPPTPPVTDTTAPTVTISSSKTEPEGGETVILSSDANDDTDGALTPSLTCDDGNLRGEFLIIPQTDIDLTITCEATATDAAGNTASAQVAIEVKPTVTSLEVADGKTNLMQGEIGVVLTKNLVLNDETYPGKLGEEDVTIFNATDGGIGFFVPLGTSVGDQVLTFELNDSTYAFEVAVEALPEISAPKDVIITSYSDRIDTLDELLHQTDFFVSQSERDFIAGIQSDLRAKIDNIDDFSEEDILEAAKLLKANETDLKTMANAVGRKLTNEEAEVCVSENGAYILSETVVVAGLVAIAGLSLKGAAATANPILVGTGGVAIAALIVNLRGADGIIDSAKNLFSCAGDIIGDIGSEVEQASFKHQGFSGKYVESFSRKFGPQNFLENETYTLKLTREREIENLVPDQFFAGLSSLINGLESIPFVPASYIQPLKDLQPTYTDVISPPISLGTVSNDMIDVTLAGSSADITLSLLYTGSDRTLLDPGIDFNIELKKDDEILGEFEATLTAVPKAQDAMVTVTSEEPSQFDVNATGANLEVTSQPQKGRVDIVDFNTFTYTSDTNQEDEDQFDFVATLGAQRSDTATVFVNIEPLEPITAESQVVSVEVGGSLNIEVVTTGDSVEIIGAPTQGQAAVSGPNNFIYTANETASGQDSFEYIGVLDGRQSEPAIVMIDIEAKDPFIGNWVITASADHSTIMGPECEGRGFREDSPGDTYSFNLIIEGVNGSNLHDAVFPSGWEALQLIDSGANKTNRIRSLRINDQHIVVEKSKIILRDSPTGFGYESEQVRLNIYGDNELDGFMHYTLGSSQCAFRYTFLGQK